MNLWLEKYNHFFSWKCGDIWAKRPENLPTYFLKLSVFFWKKLTFAKLCESKTQKNVVRYSILKKNLCWSHVWLQTFIIDFITDFIIDFITDFQYKKSVIKSIIKSVIKSIMKVGNHTWLQHYAHHSTWHTTFQKFLKLLLWSPFRNVNMHAKGKKIDKKL